jgi:hypothetical protein
VEQAFCLRLSAWPFSNQKNGFGAAASGSKRDDKAFLAIGDVAALQATADRLSPAIIRKRLDYWTHLPGPKFSKKSAAKRACRASAPSLRSSTAGISFSNAISPSHKIFERNCELGLWRLTANRISQITFSRVLFEQRQSPGTAWFLYRTTLTKRGVPARSVNNSDGPKRRHAAEVLSSALFPVDNSPTTSNRTDTRQNWPDAWLGADRRPLVQCLRPDNVLGNLVAQGGRRA